MGGIDAVLAMERLDYQEYDARILGGGEFVNRVLKLEEDQERSFTDLRKKYSWEELNETLCNHFGISKDEMDKKARSRLVARAREACVYLGIEALGMSGQDIATKLNKNRASISRAYYRASQWNQQNCSRTRALLEHLCN